MPHTSIVMSSVTNRPATSPSGPVVSVRPMVPHNPKAANDPIMNRSPWAKLMSSMIP